MSILYTRQCLLCWTRLPNYRDGQLCSRCEMDWPIAEDACRCCAEPLESTGLCGQCQQKPPDFDRVVTAGLFQQAPAWMIKRLKYRKQISWAEVLVPRFLASLQQQPGTSLPDALVPMPLHWSRLLWRGYNQSLVLAMAISQALSMPVANDLVKRQRRTPALEGLDKAARQRILRNAFTVTKQPPRHLAIVDDVMTTGSSAGALASQLKRAGAEKVELWVMARTSKLN